MRDGAELVRATKPYAIEDRGRTWRLLLVTLVLLGAAFTVAIWPGLPLPLRVAASVFQGLITVRTFIFYHDHLHGAVLRGSRVGGFIMSGVGYLVLSPRSIWRETHNYHHKNNSKIVGSAIGSFPIVSVGMWRGLKPGQRRAYALARHPLTIFFGYFTIFMGGMCISAWRRNHAHWSGPLALVLHFTGLGVLTALLGWQSALLGLALPIYIATGLGAYLFYAQHNFPATELRGRRDWDYVHAAIKCSSMFDMSPVMHWLTGNIGYHHVHHLNHRIPFYRLPEAMAAVPELQNPGRTSWRIRDIAACLRLRLWDPDLNRMVGFGEVEAPLAPQRAA